MLSEVALTASATIKSLFWLFFSVCPKDDQRLLIKYNIAALNYMPFSYSVRLAENVIICNALR
jgi:hypothetical protein